MPGVIDFETLYVDKLPGVWSPVQWELSEEERIQEIHDQATASLLWHVCAPEAILRLLLNEVEIERTLEPPDGYAPDEQGEWDGEMVTFAFRRPIQLDSEEITHAGRTIIYKFGELGYWRFEIGAERVVIERI